MGKNTINPKGAKMASVNILGKTMSMEEKADPTMEIS